MKFIADFYIIRFVRFRWHLLSGKSSIDKYLWLTDYRRAVFIDSMYLNRARSMTSIDDIRSRYKHCLVIKTKHYLMTLELLWWQRSSPSMLQIITSRTCRIKFRIHFVLPSINGWPQVRYPFNQELEQVPSSTEGKRSLYVWAIRSQNKGECLLVYLITYISDNV